jgi:NAD(P)H-hydrate epimerase
MIEVNEIPALPARPADAHKGRFGHVLVLAGSPRMTGAALLATRSALRSGAGLVTLGVPAAVQPLIAPAMLCAMSLPLPCTKAGTFSRDALQPAIDFSQNVTAVALGPGITTEEDTAYFANRVALRPPGCSSGRSTGSSGTARRPPSCSRRSTARSSCSRGTARS